MNTITYEGRTFTLTEEYEHPWFGTMRFVGLYTDRFGFFRDETGDGFVLRFDSFPRPKPEPESEPPTVKIRVTHRRGRGEWSQWEIFTHDEARAAIKALQDALGETS